MGYVWKEWVFRAVAYPGFYNGRGRGVAGAEGVRRGDGLSTSPLEEGSEEGVCPLPRKFFVFVVENTIFRRILARLFLKSYANGWGYNPPNLLLGTPLVQSTKAVISLLIQSMDFCQNV